MSNRLAGKVPTWFWVVAVLALVWNLMGVGAFFAQTGMSPEALAGMEDAERRLYETVPVWAVVAFAFAVFGGALGSLLLLLRRRLAIPVLGASFIGIVVQMGHSLFIAKSMEVYGPVAMVMPAMVLAVGILLLWLATSARGRGWLR